jgi:hypothetical protein
MTVTPRNYKQVTGVNLKAGLDAISSQLLKAYAGVLPSRGHVSTATTEAHYAKAVPEAVLKGMRLLEEKATK